MYIILVSIDTKGDKIGVYFQVQVQSTASQVICCAVLVAQVWVTDWGDSSHRKKTHPTATCS